MLNPPMAAATNVEAMVSILFLLSFLGACGTARPFFIGAPKESSKSSLVSVTEGEGSLKYAF